MKKIFIVLIVLIVLLSLPTVTGAVLFIAERVHTEESIQIRTETEPIYNHFPDLPETSEIQWCSWSSGGIGLTTVKIYFFAFYDHDVSNELEDMEIVNRSENMEAYFVPGGISGDEKWRRVENARTAFQASIKDTQKMSTVVYINDMGTIIYVEAVGD